MEHKLLVLDQLDHTFENKVSAFRTSVSDMHGNIRSHEEEGLRKDKYCSSGDIEKWILVIENEEVIGITAIFQRQLNIDNKSVLLGGIGKVRVREDRRKMGLASIMMIESMKQLKEVKSDIAYLCTDMESFLVKFYEQYGFVKMNNPYTFLSKSGKRYTEKNGMLAPINSIEIFNRIMSEKKPFDIGVGNW